MTGPTDEERRLAMNGDDGIEPETPREELLSRVAKRLQARYAEGQGAYVAWVADQVDGSLAEVVDAILMEARTRDLIEVRRRLTG